MKEEFFFKSTDGISKLHGIRWTPEERQVVGVLQLVHGMQEYIDRYDRFARFMTERGFVVVGHDHLGHGLSAATKDELGYFAETDPSGTLVKDIHLLRTKAEAQYPNVPYFMLGHSMGSYLLRKYLVSYGNGLSGAILSGTGFMPASTSKLGLAIISILTKLKGSHYRSRFVSSQIFGKSYQKFDLTGEHPENSWLTKDVEIVKKYYQDPFCTYTFTLNGFRGLIEAVLFSCSLENVKQMRKDLPIFIVSGDQDPVGDLGEGVKKVYQLMKEANIKEVDMKLYENDRHEILNETNYQTVYQDLYDWIAKLM